MAVHHVATSLLFGPLFFVFILICKIHLWAKVLYLQRGSLSEVPGPKWARWTRLWLVKTLASGRSAEKFVEVNERYGPLARIGPNHLITNDPEVTRRILGVRSGYTRGPWFDSIKIDPHMPNIVSEKDVKKHARLRSKLAAGFTGESITAMEPIIDSLLLDWIHRVDRQWASGYGDTKPFDIGKSLQYLTVDIITKLCLGKALGCVESNSDKYDFCRTVHQGNKLCQHLSVLLELNRIFYYLTKIPYLGSYITPGPSDKSGVGRIMGIVRDAKIKRLSRESLDTSDMLGLLIAKGVPLQQLDAELVIALVAGSDTTSTSVQSTLLAIILNPRVYRILKSEIQLAVQENIVSYPVQEAEAKRLPYLQACVLEGLRKFPPLSQLRERLVPPEGDFILGHRIPGGTFIGFNSWGTQINDVFGDDPQAFRPERWLTSDKDRLKSMRQTQELIFGHGSTKCLGMPMAMMELNKMIFELLRNFEFSIANPYKPWMSLCYGIFVQENFQVYITRSVQNNLPLF